MTTIHANSPRDALVRLEQMVGMAGFSLTEASIRAHIASAIKLIVQLQRFPDGQRRLISVSEVTGMKELAPAQDIFIEQFKPVPTAT